MKNTSNEKISDERLEQLLSSMHRENGEEENLRPPVINTYRMECERARRQSDLQLRITAAAAAISVLLTTIIIAVSFNMLSAHSKEIMMIPEISNAYINLMYFVSLYGREIGAVCTMVAVFIVSGYILCAVLLFKNRDKISVPRQNL